MIARAHVATADGHRVTADTSITVEISVAYGGAILVAIESWYQDESYY